MKKGWKIFWIICGCIAALGIVLCISGIVMGASLSAIRQAAWNYSREMSDEFGWSDEGYDTNTAEGGEERYVSIADIGELDVEVDYLKVNVVEGSGNEIRIYTSNIPEEVNDQLQFVQDGDTLEVDIRNERTWRDAMKNRGEAGTLTIAIPRENSLRSVDLAIGSAETLKAENIKVPELDVEIGAGKADITGFEVNSLNVEVGAGEMNLEGKASAEISIECGVGKVNYTAAGSEKDYSYDLEVGAGTVTVGSEEYSGLFSEKKIMNGGTLMEIECSIGEVNVTFTE